MLFKKTDKPTALAPDEGATYDQVIDFLVAVNDKDYQKIIKVADIYRAANVDVARASGVKLEPANSIFERQTMPIVKHGQDEPNLLDEDDELTAAFLGSEDDEPDELPKPKRRKKVKVQEGS